MTNGEIHHPHNPGRVDYLYRVSLKSVIFNDAGEVLVVKETGRDWWDLPGGGMDHGESVKEGLVRELYEEVAMQGDFTYEPIVTDDPIYLENHNLYQLRIICLVRPELFEFEAGADGDEISFIDPQLFEHSDIETESRIYGYCQLAKKRLSP